MKKLDPDIHGSTSGPPRSTIRGALATIWQQSQAQLRDFFTQSASAIGDQGFFALGNFAVNTILARQMSQAAFGRFSSAFAAFLLLSTVYCAFVVDPMLIYGVSTASGLQKSYVRRVVSLHWRAALALSLVLLSIGIALRPMPGGQSAFLSYLGWAFAAPAVLRLWLARRTAYLVFKPYYAAIGGGVYLVLIASLLLVFGRFLATNVIAACFIVAAASVLVGFCLHRSLPLSDTEPSAVSPDSILRSHWGFGKWASIAGVLAMFPDYVYFFVLSPEKCGQYRALLNVVLPLAQVYSALGVFLMSFFAQRREQPGFLHTVWRTTFAFCGVAILFAVLMAWFGGGIFGRLYGGKYDLSIGLLWPLAAVSVLFALQMVSAALLRALEKVTAMAAVAAIAALAAVAIGVPLAITFGILGAVYGDLAVYLIATVATGIVWLRIFKKTRAKAPAPTLDEDSSDHHQLAASEAP